MSRIIGYTLDIEDHVLISAKPVYEEPSFDEDLFEFEDEDFLNDDDWDLDVWDLDEDEICTECGDYEKRSSELMECDSEERIDIDSNESVADDLAVELDAESEAELETELDAELETEWDAELEAEFDADLEKEMDDYLDTVNRLWHENQGHTEYDAPDMDEVVVPEGVVEIGERAFLHCERIRKIILPESVMEIGEAAFFACTSLESVQLPEQIVKIEKNAFANCRNLREMKLPKGLKKLADHLFSGCEALEQVVIPEGVEEIGRNVFYQCSGLPELHLPDSLKKVGDGLFYAEAGFRNLVLPAGVVEIHEKNFENGKDIDWLEVAEGNPVYRSEKGMLLTADGKKLLYCPRSMQGKVIVPEGVISIGAYAFCDCEDMTEIQLPDTVEEFGIYSFAHCKFLDNITLPPKIRILPEGVFEGCSKLENIQFNETISYIGPCAFSGCSSLSRVVLPPSVKIIGEYAFGGSIYTGLRQVEISEGTWKIGEGAFELCSKLKDIKIPVSVGVLGENIFGGCGNVTIWCEPDSAAEAYAARNEISVRTSWAEGELFLHKSGEDLDEDWNDDLDEKLTDESDDTIVYREDGAILVHCPKNYKGTLNIPAGVKVIQRLAFEGCTELERVILPEGLIYIGEGAFWECDSLIEVQLPETLLEIDEKAFYGCEKLENLLLPGAVQFLGREVFSDTGIKEITLPPSLNSACGESIFRDCDKLQRVKLPGGFAGLEMDRCIRFLEDCKSLEEVVIEENSNQYYSMDGLIMDRRWPELHFCPRGRKGVLQIPEGIISVAEYAFWLNSGITGIIFPASWKGNIINDIPPYGCSIYESWFEDNGGKASLLEELSELEFVEVHQDNPYYASENGLLLSKDRKMLLYCPKKMQGVVKIPEGVDSVAWSKWNDRKFITEIHIPKSCPEGVLIFMISGWDSLREVKILGNFELFGKDIQKLIKTGAFSKMPYKVSGNCEESEKTGEAYE